MASKVLSHQGTRSYASLFSPVYLFYEFLEKKKSFIFIRGSIVKNIMMIMTIIIVTLIMIMIVIDFFLLRMQRVE